MEGFPLGKTKQEMSENIRAFIRMIDRAGLADEFFYSKNKNKEN